MSTTETTKTILLPSKNNLCDGLFKLKICKLHNFPAFVRGN